MSATNTGRLVEEYLRELEKLGVHVERAFLFGSQARGDAGTLSDFDVIVVSADFAKMSSLERWQKLGKASLNVMEPFEALAFTPEQFQERLERQGSFIQHVISRPETTEYRTKQLFNQ